MKRNYKILTYIIENFNIPNLKVERIPYVYNTEECIFYCLKIEQDIKNPYVLISAGLHGDEAPGIFALLDFLPQLVKLQKKFNFLIFPCTNIWGYIRGVRSFENRIDLNRGFWETGLTDINKVIMSTIMKYKPTLSVDIHTDSKSKVFSVFETFKNNGYTFKFDKISQLVPLERTQLIDGQKCKNGIIYSRPVEATLESFAYLNGARLSITVELPGRLEIFEQIKIGSFFLNYLFAQVDPKKFI